MLKNLILLLPCFVCLCSAITLFIRRKKSYRSQTVWMICMLLMSVCFYIWSIYYAGVQDFKMHYKLNVIDTTLALAFFPFIFLYFRTLTDETPLNWKDYLWFLPSIVIGGSSLLLYLYMGETQAMEYIRQLLMDYRDMENFTAPVFKIQYVISIICYYTVFMVQIVFGMRYTMIRIIGYRKRLDDFYSNPEGKSLENMRAMLVAVFVLLLVFLLGIVEAYLFYHHYPLLVYLLMFTYAAVLYYLSHQVELVSYTAESLVENLQQSDREAEEKGYTASDTLDNESGNSNAMKKRRHEEMIARLNQLLDEDEIFLKKDLRLDDLVRLTQANRTYVSQLIGEEFQCNFSDLINRKRIDYAQRLVSGNPSLSHAQISDLSGFVHASSFSRTFKKSTGLTFKEWCRNNSIS